MALTEQELERQLTEAGKHLLSPPSSASELVDSLDRVENLLQRVEQSPSDSMREALSPAMKALVTNELLRHTDVDVNVSVASCISEITRITAPDAPYEDEEMKEVFQLIVSAFENLDDRSSRSYFKRTSILETVAKVRSCVVMLDLECDELIAKMFQHFFKSIRNEHPENVFSSMETIMTLVLEESEDISPDLLSYILDVLKLENKEILPVARLLGEKVTEQCATKLKPYLLPAIKSRGTTIRDYSKIVANVLQVGDEAVEPSNVDAASKNMADHNDVANAPSEKAVEAALGTLDDAPPSEEVGPAAITGSPKTVVSNGVVQKEVQDTSAVGEEENNAAHDEVEASKAKVNSDAEQVTKSRTKRDKASKRKGRKTNSVKSSSEPSLTEEKEGKETLEPEQTDGKDVENAQSETPVADSAEPAENKNEPAESEKELAENQKEPVENQEPAENREEPAENQEEPAGNQEEPVVNKEEPAVDKEEATEDKVEPAEDKDEPAEDKDEPAENKDEPAENKEDPSENKEEPEATVPSPKLSEEPVDVPSPSGSLADETRLIKAGKGKKKNEIVESVPADVDSKKEPDTKKPSEETISQSKSQKRKGKKESKEDTVPSSADASKKEDEKSSELVAKSAKQSGKKVELVASQRDDKKKKGQEKGTPAKDLTKTPAKDEGKKSTGSAKLTAKSVKDESDAEKASKSSSKRKRTTESTKTSKYGEELVGSKVQVWWPEDKKFYEGVVELFDSATGKHKILYNDGDVENLKLEKEKWKLVEDGSAQGHSSDGDSPAEMTETPKPKKAKTSPVQGAKGGKTETSSKKGGASSSKSKATPKSQTKQSGNAKDETLKSIAKSDAKSGKSAGKSKGTNELDTSKGSKSKQETPKSASKKGSSKDKPAVSPMEEETEDVESSPEPAKAPENAKVKSQSASKSKKNSKKRKRSTKG